MLSTSDPFIFLGPGCPTLYYPKPSPQEPAPRQHSFIVARASVQPYAFIMPSISSSQQDSHYSTANTNRTRLGLGQTGRRMTGDKRKRSTGKDNRRTYSSQTDMLLNARDNFVFVEASQLVSQALLSSGGEGNAIVDEKDGVYVDGNISTSCFDEQNNNNHIDWGSSQASLVLENSKHFVHSNEYYEGENSSFASCSLDLKEVVFEIVEMDKKRENDLACNDQENVLSIAPLINTGGVDDCVNSESSMFKEVDSSDDKEDTLARLDKQEVHPIDKAMLFDDIRSLWDETVINETFEIDMENTLELNALDVIYVENIVEEKSYDVAKVTEEGVDMSKEIAADIVDLLLADVFNICQVFNKETERVFQSEEHDIKGEGEDVSEMDLLENTTSSECNIFNIDSVPARLDNYQGPLLQGNVPDHHHLCSVTGLMLSGSEEMNY